MNTGPQTHRRAVITLALAAMLATGCSAQAADPPASPTATDAPAVEGVTAEAEFQTDAPTGTFVEADGAVWLFTRKGVTRVDSKTNEATDIPLLDADGNEASGDYGPFGAVGFGSLWVSDFPNDEIRRYAMTGGRPTQIIPSPNSTTMLVLGDDLWVAHHLDGTVTRLDPTSGEVIATVAVGKARKGGPEGLAELDGKVWVSVENEGYVAGIDPATDAVIGTIDALPPATPCGDIGTMGTRLYSAACPREHALAVVDTASMSPVGSLSFDGVVLAPAAIGDGLWLCVARPASGPWTEGEVTRLDPETLEVGATKTVTGGAPVAIFSAGGSVWVAVEEGEADTAWLLRLPKTDF
ncbi:hypothetical protein ACH3VR_13310 [Microbacterium sp. B2969]|uniref:Virginiamycin B lyase n=1 Tax=Microbacterium alkaliflavum TaxID=3248839 RepID=A0ABW7Q907_9MICO